MLRLVRNVGLLAVVLAVFASCNAGKPGIPDNLKIGISKIVSHPALDGVELGIQDELAAQGVKAVFDLQNANGDLSTAATIANKFRNDKVNIAVGIATPTAQALVQVLSGIPVVYSAVTDPVAAKLVSSYTAGGENVTGISDMTPVKDQIKFLLAIKPSIKRVGHVYTASEANAGVLADMAKVACTELGLEFVPATVANSAEVRSATQSIVDKVDAFYVSNDNTVVSALPALIEVANNAKIPVMSADPSSAASMPVLSAWGFDYYKMGRATGKMIIEILNGKKTSEMPTRYMTEPKDVDLLINLDVAKELGISISDELKAQASTIVENGIASKKQ